MQTHTSLIFHKNTDLFCVMNATVVKHKNTTRPGVWVGERNLCHNISISQKRG